LYILEVIGQEKYIIIAPFRLVFISQYFLNSLNNSEKYLLKNWSHTSQISEKFHRNKKISKVKNASEKKK